MRTSPPFVSRERNFTATGTTRYCQECDAKLEMLFCVSSLDVTDAAIALATMLITRQALPAQAAQDALHLAMACVHGMQYLLTWNCTHLANARLRSRIEQVCREAGYIPPIICTPEELEG